jgi:8-oxo-dGTP diphosphatase
MDKYSQTILTNMCMVYDGKGNFLVQNRLKKDWPGINFPGGHVEKEESIAESVVRELKEETGLTVKKIEPVGYFEWNVPSENLRHVSLLFRTKVFSGSLASSAEGPVFWIKESDLASYPQSVDFDKVYALMNKGLRF